MLTLKAHVFGSTVLEGVEDMMETSSRLRVPLEAVINDHLIVVYPADNLSTLKTRIPWLREPGVLE